MISERTLRNWRRDALKTKDLVTLTDPLEKVIGESSERILRLTQELMDLHLVKKG